jgi:hypothetical protein
VGEQMTPAETALDHGNKFPYDAPDAWWHAYEEEERPEMPRLPNTPAHRTARGVLADLLDRRSIKHSFTGIEETTRREIVDALAAIIERGMANVA